MLGELVGDALADLAIENGIGERPVREDERQIEGAGVGHEAGEVVQPRDGDVDDARARLVDHRRVGAELARVEDRHRDLALAARLDLLLEELGQMLQVGLRSGVRQPQAVAHAQAETEAHSATAEASLRALKKVFLRFPFLVSNSKTRQRCQNLASRLAVGRMWARTARPRRRLQSKASVAPLSPETGRNHSPPNPLNPF